MPRAFVTLDSVATPEGLLELRKRDEGDFLICIANRVLMASRAHRSEDALAKLACEGLAGGRAPHVLIGGLGMGYTLRAALDGLPKDSKVTVAELNPVVAKWCEGPLASLTEDSARDPRVSIVVDDVARILAKSPKGTWDAIAIDLYEGPPLAVQSSDTLYGSAACAKAFSALKPGGRYAVWGEVASPSFERCLKSAGFDFEVHRTGHGGRVHFVYVATRKAK